jgi:hypothetical protein
MPPSIISLVADATLDGELAALAWLLVEGGVPIVVAGDAPLELRSAVAGALLDADPGRPWVLVDADGDPVDLERISALLRGGVHLGLTLRADGLQEVVARLGEPPNSLPEDAIRRLGVVLVLGLDPGMRGRVQAAHYLRPTERDAQGHIQRRPPAVLATWDRDRGIVEHYAWGITAELGERVDRSMADLEARQAARASALDRLAARWPESSGPERDRIRSDLAAAVAAEPPRDPAPPPAPPRTAPRSPLTEPHSH